MLYEPPPQRNIFDWILTKWLYGFWQRFEDLASTDTDDGTKGRNLVSVQPIAGESNIENHAFARHNILRYIPFSLHAGIRAETDATDLSTYIDYAIDSVLAANIGRLFSPAGKYNHSLAIFNSLTATANNLHFYGEGHKTKFISSGFRSFELSRDSATDNNSPHTNIRVTDLYCTSEYDGATPSGVYAGILMEFCNDSSVERVYQDKADDACIRFSGYRKGIVSQTSSKTNVGFGYSLRNKVIDCTVDNGKLGIELVGGVQCDVIRNTVLDATLHGIRMAGGGWESLVSGNRVMTCEHSALYISDVKNSSIIGNPFIKSERPTTPTALSLYRSDDVIVSDNGFIGLVGDAILSVGGDESIGIQFTDNNVDGDVDFWYTTELDCHGNDITGYARARTNTTGSVYDNMVGSLLASADSDLIQGGGSISYYGNKLRTTFLPATPTSQASILGSADAAPTSGTFRQGDIVYKVAPTDHIGWVCTVAGTPGTWESFGSVGSVYARAIKGRITGSGITQNMITFNMPNGDHAIRFIIDLMITRAPSATPAQSRIIKHEIIVARTTGAASVIDTALATNNFEVLSTTAGGTTSPTASNITATIASGGITDTQVINVTTDLAGGFVYGVYNVEVSSSSALSEYGL